MSLTGAALPTATVSKPYSESLQEYLSVNGDSALDKTAARWILVDGALPTGLVLNETTGDVAGTPTIQTTSPAIFTVLASYKGSDGQAVYTIEVGGEVIQVRQLSAGMNHSCAITESGGVKCWGSNSAGQLGDGTTTGRLAPVPVIGLESGVTNISLGWNHSCAVTEAGAAKCWGHGTFGQIGNGLKVNAKVPTQVQGFTTGVASVAAGGNHTCVLTTTDAVKCWGRNQSGQLGDGSTADKATPVQVSGLSSGVSAVAAGGSHTCAIITGGGLKCWGNDGVGQLGNNTSLTDSPIPVNVMGLTSGVASVAAWNHTCAVTTNGAAKCWGSNGYGQLGDNSLTNRPTPVAVSGLATGVLSLSTGGNHTCATSTTDGLKCWGYNGNGAVGDGTGTNRKVPVSVSGLQSGVSGFSAGGDFTCAVHNGEAKCWGGQGYGELGNNTSNKSLSPVTVVYPR